MDDHMIRDLISDLIVESETILMAGRVALAFCAAMFVLVVVMA